MDDRSHKPLRLKGVDNVSNSVSSISPSYPDNSNSLSPDQEIAVSVVEKNQVATTNYLLRVEMVDSAGHVHSMALGVDLGAGQVHARQTCERTEAPPQCRRPIKDEQRQAMEA